MDDNLSKPSERPTVQKRKSSPRQIRDPEIAQSDLIASGLKEFAEHGFAEAGIEQIAAGAGLNKRMIYHYFGSKEGLYIAVLEKVYLAIREGEEGLDLEELSPVEAIRSLVEFTWDYFLRYPELLAIVSLENTLRGQYISKSEKIKASTVRLVSRVETVMKRGVEEGSMRDGIEPIQLIHSIAGLGFYYLNNRYTNSVIYDMDMMTEDALNTRRRYMVETTLAFLRPAG